MTQQQQQQQQEQDEDCPVQVCDLCECTEGMDDDEPNEFGICRECYEWGQKTMKAQGREWLSLFGLDKPTLVGSAEINLELLGANQAVHTSQ